MRIGFDVSQTAERMAGCGIVADQFLRHLVQASPRDVFIPYPIFGNYRTPDFVRACRPQAPNVVTDHFRLSWEELNRNWDAPCKELTAFLGRPDLVHANNYFCPRDLGVPLVYTLYDLSQIECPEFHTERNRVNCFSGLFDASIFADHIVAISEHSRRTFLEWFPHFDPDRVSVVPLAARPSIAQKPPDDEIRKVLERYDLAPDSFWLAVGTIEPRKNYGLLLDAYARMMGECPDSVMPLCIAGQAGWLESSLEGRIRSLGIGDRVRCLGFVEDADLAALYRTCFAFLYPSWYEGFGLPAVEAMACGTAVIALRTTSLPEVVGDGGILVSVEDVDRYADAMQSLVRSPARRAALRAAASAQAARFSWSRSADMLLDIYRSLVDRKSRSRRQAPA